MIDRLLDQLDPNATHLKYVDEQPAICFWYPDSNGAKATTDPSDVTCSACTKRIKEILDREHALGAEHDPRFPADDPRRGRQCGCGAYGDHDETHEEAPE